MSILVVTGYRTIIRKSSKLLIIEHKENTGEIKKEHYPVVNLSGIIVDVNVTITGFAFELLVSHSVPILHLSSFQAIAITHPIFVHGSVIVRKQQFEALNDARGVDFAKNILLSGLVNKRRLLQYYSRKVSENDELEEPDINNNTILPNKVDLEPYIQRIGQLEEQLKKVDLIATLNALRSTLLGIEGAGGQAYFQALQQLIPPEWGFNQRLKHPATDPFNALISYLYVILSGRITIDTIITGLEPFAGFIHTDRSGRASLGLDLVEQFRQPFVDRFVLRLVRRKILQPQRDFKGIKINKAIPITEQGTEPVLESPAEPVELNESGKKILFQYWEEWLDEKISLYGKKLTRHHIMKEQVMELVRVLMRKRESYRPYLEKY